MSFGSTLSSVVLTRRDASDVYASIKLTTWRTALRRQMNNLDSVSRALHTDVLLNWESVKCFGNEGFEAERYQTSLVDYQKAAYQVQASLNILNLVQTCIICAGTLATTMLVASSVVQGKVSPSQFVVFITYLSQVYGPLSMLGTLYRVVQQNLVDTDKLMSLLEEEADIKDEPGAKDLIVTDGVVEFEDVHFAYDNGRVPALRGLSFKLSPKSACALVGESGSGKSTILRLLLRFYSPQQGRILIDGQDIAKVTQQSLRKAIGVVPQEASLFNASIRTNILYGKTDASEDDIREAAEAAQIWDKIQTFPDGMNTVVGERGVRLSGGEKQRTVIARAFLKRAPLLLCDEATSALDSGTERLLQTALTELLKGRTSLTIAHRLSTIINSNVIHVIKDGKLVEAGTHEELVQREGEYSVLWLKQIQTQKEAEAAAAAAAQVKADAQLASTSPKSPGVTPMSALAAKSKEELTREAGGFSLPDAEEPTLAEGIDQPAAAEVAPPSVADAHTAPKPEEAIEAEGEAAEAAEQSQRKAAEAAEQSQRKDAGPSTTDSTKQAIQGDSAKQSTTYSLAGAAKTNGSAVVIENDNAAKATTIDDAAKAAASDDVAKAAANDDAAQAAADLSTYADQHFRFPGSANGAEEPSPSKPTHSSADVDLESAPNMPSNLSSRSSIRQRISSLIKGESSSGSSAGGTPKASRHHKK